MPELFVEYYSYILTGHVLFMAVGIGGATITDVLFFKFLRDHAISKQELSVMNTMSQVIWMALGGIVATGMMLFLPNAESFLASDRFLGKMTVVSVIIINGVLLNFWVAPKMINIFPIKGKALGPGLRRLRKFAFALGGVSIISWYSAFILGSLRTFNFSYEIIMGVYLSLLCIAVVGSQVSENKFSKNR